jgi:glyoxylase-like metal-dependent hydrolase (beta-lactamase superfamily II)
VLIDTGSGEEALLPLAKSGQVDLVLISHIHPDHMALNYLFADKKILVPKMAADSAESLEAMGRRFFPDPEIRAMWMEFVKHTMGFKDCPISGVFGREKVFDLGSTRLKVIFTPGHTIDHCCFFLPQWDVFLSADIDLTGFGPWYGNPEGDIAQTLDSINKVMEINPGILVSSHKGIINNQIRESLLAYARIIEKRSRKICGLLKKPKNLEQIVDAAIIYGGFPFLPRLLRHWEGQMVQKHLVELMSRGRVALEGDMYKAL